MSEVEIPNSQEQVKINELEEMIDPLLSEERRKIVSPAFVESLRVSTDDKAQALYKTLMDNFTVKPTEDGYVLEKKLEAGEDWKNQLEDYLDGLEKAHARAPFENVLRLSRMDSAKATFVYDENNQVLSLRLGGVEPAPQLTKVGEDWKMDNFALTYTDNTGSVATWKNALCAAISMHKVIDGFGKGSFNEGLTDTNDPFVDNNGILCVKVKGRVWGENNKNVDDNYAVVPKEHSVEFMKKINHLYRVLLAGDAGALQTFAVPEPAQTEASPAAAPAATPAPTPGETPPTTGGSGTEKPAEAVPETVSAVNPEYVENMREKMKEIKSYGETPEAHTLELNFENSVKENDVPAIQSTGDAILARWKELLHPNDEVDMGVTVAAATAPTNSQTAEAGAESGTGIDSHEAFRAALKNNPSGYFVDFDYGDKGRGISLQLPNAEAVKYSLVQDFLGKEGEAEIGLSDEQLNKTTVTLLVPGEVSRAGHVGQVAGTEYTWQDGTWKDANGDRLKVYWNTQFSYKTEEGSEAGGGDIIPNLIAGHSALVAKNLEKIANSNAELSKQLAAMWAKAIESKDRVQIDSAASVISAQARQIVPSGQ